MDPALRTPALVVALALTVARPAVARSAAAADGAVAAAPEPPTFAVLAVGDAPSGPAPWVADATHLVRAALRDRAYEVLGLPELKGRLVGEKPPASLAEFDRMYDQAQAAFDEGELEVAARLLRGTAESLERVPDAPQVYDRWLRAMFQLAYAQRAAHQLEAAAATLERVVAADPKVVGDAFLYPPSLLAQLEEVRGRVQARRTARLTVAAAGLAGGAPATAFVNGHGVGSLPAELLVPPGRYRVTGAAGELRTPALVVEVPGSGRTLELELGLAAALRPGAGPGMALEPAARPGALGRAGRALGVEYLVAVAGAEEGGAPVLVATLHDGPSGAPLREARLRPERAFGAGQAAALVNHLLTGAGAPGVTPVVLPDGLLAGEPLDARRRPADALELARALTAVDLRSPDTAQLVLRGAGRPGVRENPLAPLPRADWELAPARRWRTASLATGGAAALLLGFTVWQAVASHQRYGTADAMLLADGSFKAGVDPASYPRAVADGDAAKRNAVVGAVGTAVLAVAAGWFGHLSAEGGVPVLSF